MNDDTSTMLRVIIWIDTVGEWSDRQWPAVAPLPVVGDWLALPDSTANDVLDHKVTSRMHYPFGGPYHSGPYVVIGVAP